MTDSSAFASRLRASQVRHEPALSRGDCRSAPLWPRTFLIVDLTAVRDPCDIDCFGGVVDSVDDAIVADANSPQIRRAMQLFAAGRPRIIRKLTNLWLDALNRVRGEGN